jgi:Mrp family chromosome partitioning ATPase
VKQPWRLPRQAASCYAGYQDVSARLKSCFLETPPEEEQIIFVLSGMGGVGKSESVLQFLKKHNKDLRKR